MYAELKPEEGNQGRIIKKALIVSFLIFLAGILVFLKLRAFGIKGGE